MRHRIEKCPINHTGFKKVDWKIIVPLQSLPYHKEGVIDISSIRFGETHKIEFCRYF